MSSPSRLLYQAPVAVALLAACNTPTKLALYGITPFMNRLIEDCVPIWELFEHCCGCGHINLVRRLNAKGFRNLKRGVYQACAGGHLDVVQLLIDKGSCDWNWGLTMACKHGRREIVDMMIANGATRCYYWQCKGHKFVTSQE